MTNEKKLEALSRRLEIVERQIVDAQQATQKILEQREALLSEVIAESERIERELDYNRKSKRANSLRSGDINSAVLVCELEKKLEHQIKMLKQKIDDRTKEVARAKERLAAVNEELKENRSSNKRLDRLIENRENINRVIKYAGEEVSQDELRKKGIKQ